MKGRRVRFAGRRKKKGGGKIIVGKEGGKEGVRMGGREKGNGT